MSAVAFLFHCYLATNKLVGWRTSNQGISRKFNPAFRAYAWLCREIFDDAFLKALYERSFAAFSILEKLRLTFSAEYLNRFGRLFLVWFSHRS